jgi:hypothetical protein
MYFRQIALAFSTEILEGRELICIQSDRTGQSCRATIPGCRPSNSRLLLLLNEPDETKPANFMGSTLEIRAVCHK